MNIQISTVARSTFTHEVRLDGQLVGMARFENSYRAPKKWSATRNVARPVEVGRFASMEEAAFEVARDALSERHKHEVLAALGVSS